MIEKNYEPPASLQLDPSSIDKDCRFQVSNKVELLLQWEEGRRPSELGEQVKRTSWNCWEYCLESKHKIN